MAKANLFKPTSGGFIEHDHNNDGIDRRGFLKCMAWAGTGALCVIQGDVLNSYALSSPRGSAPKSNRMGELSFVQISDSHMGFNKPANPDVISTLKAAVDKINGHGPALLRCSLVPACIGFSGIMSSRWRTVRVKLDCASSR